MNGRERILVALRELTADGWPTSVRPVGRHAGIASTGFIHETLHDLKRDGLAIQHPRETKLGWKAVV